MSMGDSQKSPHQWGLLTENWHLPNYELIKPLKKNHSFQVFHHSHLDITWLKNEIKVFKCEKPFKYHHVGLEPVF